MNPRALVTLMLLAACSDGTSTPAAPTADVPRADAGRVCPSPLPPPNRPCLTGCGNERGVGMPCTRGGGQCNRNGFSNAFLCTVDVAAEDEPAFCTMACVQDRQCGTGAVCTGDPDNPARGRGCFPIACLDRPNADGGSDVALRDASSD